MKPEIFDMSSVVALGALIVALSIHPTFSLSNIAESSPSLLADQVYVFTFSNLTGSDKITFSSSEDGGKTIGSKINLLDNTNENSTGVFIGNKNIVISWSEQNRTAGVSEISTQPNNGVTLGIILLQPLNNTSSE